MITTHCGTHSVHDQNPKCPAGVSTKAAWLFEVKPLITWQHSMQEEGQNKTTTKQTKKVKLSYRHFSILLARFFFGVALLNIADQTAEYSQRNYSRKQLHLFLEPGDADEIKLYVVRFQLLFKLWVLFSLRRTLTVRRRKPVSARKGAMNIQTVGVPSYIGWGKQVSWSPGWPLWFVWTNQIHLRFKRRVAWSNSDRCNHFFFLPDLLKVFCTVGIFILFYFLYIVATHWLL